MRKEKIVAEKVIEEKRAAEKAMVVEEDREPENSEIDVDSEDGKRVTTKRETDGIHENFEMIYLGDGTPVKKR